MKRISAMLLTILVVCAFLPVNCFAEASYQGYNYNFWGESIPSPSGYLPIESLTGVQMGAGPLNAPQDLFRDDLGNLYIADTGNRRVIQLNRNLQLVRIIDTLKSGKGDVKLKTPKGIFVDRKGRLYIADTESQKVYVTDPELNIVLVIGKFKSDILPKDFNYQPDKVITDRSGNIYILSQGCFQGLLMFTPEGAFQGFFGSNRVEVTLNVLNDMFWKRILNRQQRAAMARTIPVEYSNLVIDPEGFIYTTTKFTQSSTDEIKKLNAKGINILRNRTSVQSMKWGGNYNYGDQERSHIKGKTIDSTFVDLCVDGDGIITALDSERCKLFQYDQESSLMFVFGGMGDQLGSFRQPTAVENLDGRILVLDAGYNNLTIFDITEFGTWVRKATKLYYDGFYEEAVEPWKEVLKRNSNYELAYVGIGKALMRSERYTEALEYFKLGNDRIGYSEAFKYARTQVLRDNFSLAASLLLGLILLIYCLTHMDQIRNLYHRIRARGVFR